MKDTVNFVRLDQEGASLEFSAEAWPLVRKWLRAFGPITDTPEAGRTTLAVGTTKLTFLDEEWDGPALLATDVAGTSMLEAIAAGLVQGDAESKLRRRPRPAKPDRLTA